MQGKREFEQKLFCGLNLMEVIGEDHLLVRLNDALDLDWISDVAPFLLTPLLQTATAVAVCPAAISILSYSAGLL